MVDQGLTRAAGLARIGALAACLAAAAIVLTEGILTGLVAFLRDLLVALALPFAILLGMAGWEQRLRAMIGVPQGLHATQAGHAPSVLLLLPLSLAAIVLVAAASASGARRFALCLLAAACTAGAALWNGGWLAWVLATGALLSLGAIRA